MKDQFNGDILVITPLYPSTENPYACAFVHTRVQTYQAAGLAVDVAVQAFDGVSRTYEFEGVRAHMLSQTDLGELLRARTYKTICVHFLELSYARVIEACDLRKTRILFWGHGGDVCYWDRSAFTTPYFSAPRVMPNDELAECRARDAMLARFNAMPNVTFVPVSDFVKNRSEELLGFTWNSYEVIHNPIDFDTFSYQVKSPDLRRRVFCAKTQDNASNYAMDTVVRTILALSRRACFADMEFTLVGAGNYHEELVAPLRRFANAHIIDRFMTHAELAAAHKEHGIALFPTRFDAQGVSMCEAAASGLAVVSSKRDSVADFLADDGLLVDTDDFNAYADAIERMYNDADYFAACCKASHDKVAAKCAYERTTAREIALVSEGYTASAQVGEAGLDGAAVAAPVLALVVATEDDCAVGAFARLAGAGMLSGVEVVCAPTYAEALERVRAPYCKLLGARDFVCADAVPELVEKLDKCKYDAVLCSYEDVDYATESTNIRGRFDFMVPGVSYAVDDLIGAPYGFGDEFPTWKSAIYRTEVLRAPGALDALCGSDGAEVLARIETLGYFPRVCFTHRRPAPVVLATSDTAPAAAETAHRSGLFGALRNKLRS